VAGFTVRHRVCIGLGAVLQNTASDRIGHLPSHLLRPHWFCVDFVHWLWLTASVAASRLWHLSSSSSPFWVSYLMP